MSDEKDEKVAVSIETTPLKPEEKKPKKEEASKLTVFLSLFALVGVAVFKTQVTAMLFGSSNYPTAFSLLSTLVTCAMLVPVFIFIPKEWNMCSWELVFPKSGFGDSLLIVVAFTAVDLGTSNIALAELSTALFQCIAACNPFATAIIEAVVSKKRQHWVIYIVVSLLVAGAVLAELGHVERSSVYGLTAAILQVMFSSSKYVFAHSILQKTKGSLGSISLLFWIDLFMIPIYIVWVLLNGEMFAILDAMKTWTGLTWVQVILTSGLGGIRALTQFVVLVFVTATSMSTANITTQILNILISIPIQHLEITAMLVFGITTTISAAVTYSALKMNRQWLEAIPDCGR